jgi:chromosome segregation ATPase
MQHQAELERVKKEAAASQKLAADNAERFEKQRKSNAILEARIEELRKITTSDQSELKDLRHKLRVLELEREKALSKQPEINELKKSLATIEAKQKEELKDRDRRIAELDKHLQTEKKKHESFEIRAQDAKRGLVEEAQSNRVAIQQLEALVQEAQEECRVAKDRSHQIEQNACSREEALVERLEQHRTLLSTVAEQYGALASQSVSLATHDRLKQDHVLLQFRQLRLERKLANAEGQVVELAHLIRHLNEKNTYLQQELSSTLEGFYPLAHFDKPAPGDDDTLETSSALVLGHILQPPITT